MNGTRFPGVEICGVEHASVPLLNIVFDTFTPSLASYSSGITAEIRDLVVSSYFKPRFSMLHKFDISLAFGQPVYYERNWNQVWSEVIASL